MLESILQNLIKTWTGPKIMFTTLGAPAHLSFIGLLPGSSKIFESGYQFYGEDSILNVLSYDENRKYVSLQTCFDLMDELIYIDDDKNSVLIAVTSALSSNRPRKGNNTAYVTIKTDYQQYYCINFPKLNESDFSNELLVNETRISQDKILTCIILRLLTESLDSIQKDFPDISIEKL